MSDPTGNWSTTKRMATSGVERSRGAIRAAAVRPFRPTAAVRPLQATPKSPRRTPVRGIALAQRGATLLADTLGRIRQVEAVDLGLTIE